MAKLIRSKRIRNQKGIATLELIPLLTIFVVLIGFALGMFGVIHTSILNSMAARTYAFETFRHRPYLIYFRNNRDSTVTYEQRGLRYHASISENLSASNDDFVSTGRQVSFGFRPPQQGMDVNTHQNEVMTITDDRFTGTGVNPVWIRIKYGMCLDATCGGAAP